MHNDPGLTWQQIGLPSRLEQSGDLLDDHLNLHFDLLWLSARHLLSDLLQNLGMVLGRELGLEALFLEQGEHFLDSGNDSEVFQQVVTLDLSHVLFFYFLLGLFLRSAIVILLLVLLGWIRLLLLRELVHELNEFGG